ncbi:MAG: hypothetical protein K940chlam3_01579, partial [Chlamydiae bacterium]|nr:hypothetical protein [Chlamydiota bacterium]
RFEACLEQDSGIHSQAEQLLKRAKVEIRGRLSDVSFKELTNLMRLFVSSKRYLEVAEKIKCLPATYILKDIFDYAKRLSVSIEGIDIDHSDYDHIISENLIDRVGKIEHYDDSRIQTFVENLMKFRDEREGLIFVCGALHANHLISSIEKKGLLDNVVYCFPHSSKRYDDSFDGIKEFCKGEVLKGHTHCLSTAKDIQVLARKIVEEIKSKNIRYVTEVEGNSHSDFLSHVFDVKFKVFKRPGYYVDAMLNIDETPEYKSIEEKLHRLKIQTHRIFFQEHNYLVVSEVNTPEVAEKIRKLM